MLISVGAADADQAGGAAGATATGTDGMIIWFSVPFFPSYTGECVLPNVPDPQLRTNEYTMQ